MMPLLGEPLLAHVVRRVARATSIEQLVVATTVEEPDTTIARLCETAGWECFRGSETDVLDRYYQAACEYRADAVVRITSDSPLVDPGLIDLVVRGFVEHQPEVDYASNTLERSTYPIGLSVEVIKFDALAKTWGLADQQVQREHVTPFIYRHPELFCLHGTYCDRDYSQYRWTVDTTDDFELVRRIYEYFGQDEFSWREALEVMEQHPEWHGINRDVVQRSI
jgi:spore coat polysaccharide biosynthesis protein SpsF